MSDEAPAPTASTPPLSAGYGKEVIARFPRELQHGGASQVWMVARDCRGALLLETVIAVTVFALVGVAVLTGLSTAYTSGNKTEIQSVTENLARNQMESIFSGPYREPHQTPYPTITGIPASYSVHTAVEFQDHLNPDPEVERISVTARHSGQDIMTLETLRGRDDGLQLRYSLLLTRSLSERLHGKTISGIMYVFLDDPELMVDHQVDFYLDGAYIQTENFPHWDFKGTLGILITDLALPWVTNLDPAAGNGQHTIAARVLLADGNTVNVTADFTIDNCLLLC